MGKKTAKVDLSKVDRKKLLEVIEKRSKVLIIPVGEIHPNPWNKNKMGAQYFAALKANLANPNIGFTQPVLVRPHPELKDEWQIVDGEHRHKAAIEVGYEKVPCINMDGMPDALAKYLMLEQNAVRGTTKDTDQKDILAEIEADPEWQKFMQDFNPYAGTVTDEPVENPGKYDIEDELDSTSDTDTQLISLYLSKAQIEVYRRVIGQIRLARAVTAEAAVLECIAFFEESTGIGINTGDENLDDASSGE